MDEWELDIVGYQGIKSDIEGFGRISKKVWINIDGFVLISSDWKGLRWIWRLNPNWIKLGSDSSLILRRKYEENYEEIIINYEENVGLIRI